MLNGILVKSPDAEKEHPPVDGWMHDDLDECVFVVATLLILSVVGLAFLAYLHFFR